MGNIDDRKPFRGKCPIDGRVSRWTKEYSVAFAWVEGHLGSRHNVKIEQAAQDLGIAIATLVVVEVRTYVPTKRG